MCQQRGKDLDDPWFDELDPVLKVYMYEHWCLDQEEAFELARSQAILIGSFFNPMAAQEMAKANEPDFSSSDADFERSLQMVEESNKTNEQVKRKRHRKIASLKG